MRPGARRLAALALALATVAAAAPASVAADAGELRIVTVLPGAGAGTVSAVADVQPAPTAALPGNAATVVANGSEVRAATSPLLAPDAPTAVVVDTSDAGASALPQTLSGAAAFLLRLPTVTPVTLTADGGTPSTVTAAPASPAEAIRAMIRLRPGGERATAQAVDLALRGLPAAGDGRALVLLGTTGGPPSGTAAADLGERLRAAGAVLAVVTAPQFEDAWAEVADATGGTATGTAPAAAADAFDAVSRVLRGRSVVTFTPPAGATQADLRVQTGGAVVSAGVQLAAAGAPSPGAAAAPAPATAATAASSGGGAAPLVALLVLAAAVVAGAVLYVVRRRRTAGSSSGPEPVETVDRSHRLLAPEPESQGAPEREAERGRATPGVRYFDVSDPDEPVELDTGQRDSDIRDRSA